MNKTRDKSSALTLKLSTAALISGIGLILMTILALIAMPSVQGLAEIENTSDLVNKVTAQESSLRLNIVLILIIVMLDAILAWSLYVLVRPVDKDLALLQGWLRLTYAAIFAVALSNLSSITNLLPVQGSALQIASLMHNFINGWNLGLAIFGLHLVVLGYLIAQSSYIPKWIGYLVVLAGAGYIVDSIGKVLSADYALNVGMFTFFGEVLLGFWLAFKARKLNLRA